MVHTNDPARWFGEHFEDGYDQAKNGALPLDGETSKERPNISAEHVATQIIDGYQRLLDELVMRN